MMDGRVKTLHPAIHGGILARRPPAGGSRRHRRATGSRRSTSWWSTSIRSPRRPQNPGHAVRRAGRGDRHRRPEPAPRRGQELPRRAGGRRSGRLPAGARAAPPARRPVARVPLQADAEGVRHTAPVRRMIAMTMQIVEHADGAMTRSAAADGIIRHRSDLRYGENPHQKAPGSRTTEPFSPAWEVHQGKELSYTNLLDLDAALRIALEFTEPVGVVIKHTNPAAWRPARRLPRPTCARARPIRSRPSAASSGSTGRWTSRRRGR